MKHFITGIAIAFLMLSTTVQAGVIVGGTRVIYQEGKREASISVTNEDPHTPYLIQSWVTNYSKADKSHAPFIVTPPLFRLDAGQKNILRINFTGAALPKDRESVFWLNVKSIAPTRKEETNELQINIKSQFKIFYRPNGLAGDPADAWKKVNFHVAGNRLIAQNPTPYYVSFFSLSVAGKELQEPGMIGPGETKAWPVRTAGVVKWRAINDLGGVTDSAQQ
jgi:P pilus assembly chaperone PapD